MPNPQGQIGMKGPLEIPYEEGIWVPLDTSGGGLVLVDLGCSFYIVGRLVFAFINVTYPVNADINLITIGGLPVLPLIIGGGGGTGWVFTDLGAFGSAAIDFMGNVNLLKPTGVQYTNVEASGISLAFMAVYIRA